MAFKKAIFLFKKQKKPRFTGAYLKIRILKQRVNMQMGFKANSGPYAAFFVAMERVTAIA